MKHLLLAVCTTCVTLTATSSFAYSSCISRGLLDRKATAESRAPDENWSQSEIDAAKEGIRVELIEAEKTCLEADAQLALEDAKRKKVEADIATEHLRVSKLPGVRLGMTAKTVMEKTNWERPQEVNRTINKLGTHEQWVYGNGSYLYFDNGKLTSIQD